MKHRALLESLHLADLIEPAERNEALTRTDLERLLRARNPLAAASLADARRKAASDVTVTYPVTLRVRVPGLEPPHEDATKVSFALADLAGIEATEMQMTGSLPAGLPLAHAIEIVRSLVAARRDLPLRAFTADDVAAIAAQERTSFASVVAQLAKAGVATLDWRPGADASPDAVRVHRAAHEEGMRTVAPVPYARGGVGKAFLERLAELRAVAESTRGFLSAVLVPDRTEGASPLDGTSGTEDWLAFALARLALGHAVPHVTVDAHVLGHKLGATLLSCGADDFVGAQAARAWAPPTDDGPRPLNPARVTKSLIEARRSPVRRDGIFRATA
jgi:aminodeoxyfutalosine synthase